MEEKILDLLEEICEDDIIREERDMDLFEEDILDSRVCRTFDKN